MFNKTLNEVKSQKHFDKFIKSNLASDNLVDYLVELEDEKTSNSDSRDVLEAKNRLIVERIKEIKHYTGDYLNRTNTVLETEDKKISLIKGGIKIVTEVVKFVKIDKKNIPLKQATKDSLATIIDNLKKGIITEKKEKPVEVIKPDTIRISKK